MELWRTCNPISNFVWHFTNFLLAILGPHTRILVTGGGSVNNSILQIMADVFNAPVYTQVSEYWPFFLDDKDN